MKKVLLFLVLLAAAAGAYWYFVIQPRTELDPKEKVAPPPVKEKVSAPETRKAFLIDADWQTYQDGRHIDVTDLRNGKRVLLKKEKQVAIAREEGGRLVPEDVQVLTPPTLSKLIWAADIGDHASGFISFKDHIVFGTDAHAAICVDGNSGEVRWESDLSGQESDPVVFGDFVLVADPVGRIAALREKDGKEKGEFFCESSVEHMAASGDRLAIVTLDNRVLLFQTKKGMFGRLKFDLKWEKKVAEGYNPSLSILDTYVVVTNGQGALTILDLQGQSIFENHVEKGDKMAQGQATFQFVDGANLKELVLKIGDRVVIAYGKSMKCVPLGAPEPAWEVELPDTAVGLGTTMNWVFLAMDKTSALYSLAQGEELYRQGFGGEMMIDGSTAWQFSGKGLQGKNVVDGTPSGLIDLNFNPAASFELEQGTLFYGSGKLALVQ